MNSFILHLRNVLHSPGRANRGETITEALVSVLIGGLALLMLATVIATSTNLVTQTRANMNTYFQGGNEVVARTGTPDATGTATAQSGTGGAIAVPLSTGKGSVDTGYYVFGQGGVPIVAYKEQ